MSARRRRRTKRRYRRDRRGRFLPAVRRKRKRGQTLASYRYFVSWTHAGVKQGQGAGRWTRREARTLAAQARAKGKKGVQIWQARKHGYGYRRINNPLLQIVGYPLSRTGNPWGSVAQGFAMGVGADVAGRAMRKAWGRNPRPGRAGRALTRATRRMLATVHRLPVKSLVTTTTTRTVRGNGSKAKNPPRPGQKILSERAMTVAEARRFPGFMAAANGYKRFHGSAPSSVSLVRIADGQKQVTRRAVFAMGKAPEMTYKPLPGQKTNKAGATWVHKMGEHGGKPPLLVHDPKSGVTSFVGGTFRVADWVRH